jgi:hypothetical protein
MAAPSTTSSSNNNDTNTVTTTIGRIAPTKMKISPSSFANDDNYHQDDTIAAIRDMATSIAMATPPGSPPAHVDGSLDIVSPVNVTWPSSSLSSSSSTSSTTRRSSESASTAEGYFD